VAGFWLSSIVAGRQGGENESSDNERRQSFRQARTPDQISMSCQRSRACCAWQHPGGNAAVLHRCAGHTPAVPRGRPGPVHIDKKQPITRGTGNVTSPPVQALQQRLQPTAHLVGAEQESEVCSAVLVAVYSVRMQHFGFLPAHPGANVAIIHGGGRNAVFSSDDDARYSRVCSATPTLRKAALMSATSASRSTPSTE